MYYFDYAIIKYMPNPKRGEIINIGLIIFKPTTIDVRVLAVAHKAALLDGMTTDDNIFKIKDSFEELAKLANSPKNNYELITSCSKSIFLSDKAYFSINTLNEYEEKIQSLLNILVKPIPKKTKTTKTPRLQAQIKETFQRMSLLGESAIDIENHKVIANFLLEESTGLTADFVLKNTIYHVSQVIDYSVSDQKTKYKETCLKTMGFIESKKILKNTKGYLVFFATNSEEKGLISQLNLAQQYSDDMFNMMSHEDAIRYYQTMSNLAGRHLQIGMPTLQ